MNDTWDFIRRQSRIHDSFQGNTNIHYHNVHDHGEPDYDDYNMNNDVRRNINDDVRRNANVGDRYHGAENITQRLYPLLPDINDNRGGFVDDDDYIHVDNNPSHADDRQCIVCFERVRNAAIFPCGHAQMCEQCTRNIMTGNNLCPVCKRMIAEYRTIYI